MAHASNITAGVYSKVIAFLAPLFLDALTNDTQAARLTAIATVDAHKPRNDTELRLVALITAFSLGALDALSRAANPELTDAQALRLRGNANALSRAAVQNQKLLDLIRAAPPADLPVPQDLPATAATPDLVAFARAAGSPLSRQQRRLAERQAEKTRKRQEEVARLAQRAAAMQQQKQAAA